MSEQQKCQLSINIEKIEEFFTCPICMCEINATNTTPCGHRFCRSCITDCIDAHNRCPICNRDISVNHLIQDKQFDTLIGLFRTHKEEMDASYIAQTLQSADSQGNQKSELLVEVRHPLHSVLKKHLSKSIHSHERFYQNLLQEYGKKKEKILERYKQKKDTLPDCLSVQDMAEREIELENSQELELEALKNELHHSASSVASAYDRFLSERLTNLDVLPVKISINILCKNTVVKDVLLKPTDGIQDIKERVERHMKRVRYDEVKKFSDVKFICLGPFAKGTVFEINQLVSDIAERGVKHPDAFIIPDNSKPHLEFGIKPGSEIVVYGKVLCQSDMPKLCFAKTFRKDKGNTCDYFSCRSCGFNWICRSCMDVCHKGHNTVPHVMNHKPSWACCYCPKKKTCTLTDETDDL